MYKVFLNDRSIIIDRPGSGESKSNRVFSDDVSRYEVKEAFAGFLSGNLLCEKWHHADPGYFFLLVSSIFHQLPAAGGVILNKGKILFIYRNGKWDLPKGKIEDGEDAARAALREVKEECGIKVQKISRQLPSTYHIYKSPYTDEPDNWILKETYWFEMEYHGNSAGEPQTDEGITQLQWFPINELETVLENTYANLKQIIHIYRA